MQTATRPEQVRRTRSEIDALVEGWKSDGCWDLEETEGFEAHRDELLAIREGIEREQAIRYASALDARAKLRGLSAADCARDESLDQAERSDRERAERLLAHYFDRAGVSLDGGGRAEIGCAVESMISAAASRVERELIERRAEG